MKIGEDRKTAPGAVSLARALLLLHRANAGEHLGGHFEAEGIVFRKCVGQIDHLSDERNIYLDFDRRIPRLIKIFSMLRLLFLKAEYTCFRRTRRGWHLIIRLREKLRPMEQVALQVLLGSDRRREMLNFMRARYMARHRVSKFWRQRWNILFGEKIR